MLKSFAVTVALALGATIFSAVANPVAPPIIRAGASGSLTLSGGAVGAIFAAFGVFDAAGFAGQLTLRYPGQFTVDGNGVVSGLVSLEDGTLYVLEVDPGTGAVQLKPVEESYY